ncbi:MAG: crossover junction endodeoxyribonuclease RuvC [bacterium]
MVILGIDPGIAQTGYGIIEENKGLRLIKAGIIKTDKKMPKEKRLLFLYNGLLEIIKEFSPESCGIEDVFFFKNAKTAMGIGEAKGICILASAYSSLPIYDYTPLQIKQAITGFGRATKLQVQEMIKRLLGLSYIIKPDDAADGVACAICHIQSLWSKNI